MASKKSSAKTKSTASSKPAAKKTTAASTAATEEKVVTTSTEVTTTADNQKELDEMVAAMKKDAAKAAGKPVSTEGTAKKGGFGWGTLIIILLIIGLIGYGVYYVFQQMQAQKVKESLPEIITLLGGDMKLQEIKSFEPMGGVYKFEFTFEEYPDEPFTSYISKDGKTFFVEGYDVAELKGETSDSAENASPTPTPTPQEVSKSENPELTAYIVADCPYGKQMQEVMSDAIAQAPEIKDNFEVRYFFTSIADDGSSYVAMHGAEEGMENVRQICIREEQRPLYWDYVDCYAAGGSSDSCLTSTKVDKAKVEACIKSPTRGVKFAKADDQMSIGHSVTGSPTLILNDTDKVSESSFGGRNAQGLKNIVCSSADNSLSFCDDTLSTETAAASGNC